MNASSSHCSITCSHFSSIRTLCCFAAMAEAPVLSCRFSRTLEITRMRTRVRSLNALNLWMEWEQSSSQNSYRYGRLCRKLQWTRKTSHHPGAVVAGPLLKQMESPEHWGFLTVSQCGQRPSLSHPWGLLSLVSAEGHPSLSLRARYPH